MIIFSEDGNVEAKFPYIEVVEGEDAFIIIGLAGRKWKIPGYLLDEFEVK